MVGSLKRKGQRAISSVIASRPEIIVEVRGGTVVDIYSDIPRLKIVLVDWDDKLFIDPDEPCAGIFPIERTSSLPEDTFVEIKRAGL